MSYETRASLASQSYIELNLHSNVSSGRMALESDNYEHKITNKVKRSSERELIASVVKNVKK